MDELKLHRGRGPIYVQIINLVLRDLARGALLPGDQLPSARELALRLNVNPNTVIHAYSELERRGITYTKRGLGTYVRPEVPIRKLREAILRQAAEDFWGEVQALGLTLAEAVRALEEVAHDCVPEERDQTLREG